MVQQAVKLIIEPIFEADFKSFSYGYRPGRSTKEASREIYKYMNFGISGIIDLDIKGFFDHVDHNIMIVNAGQDLCKIAGVKVIHPL